MGNVSVAEVRLHLRADASLEEAQEGTQRLLRPRAGIAVGRGAGARELLAALAGDGLSDLDRGRLTLADVMLVQQLDEKGWIARRLVADGRLVASLEPVSRRGAASEGAADVERAALSRFASLRAEGGNAVLDSPAAPARLVLHEPAVGAATAGALAVGARLSELEPVQRALAELMIVGGLAKSLDDGDPEHEFRELAQWSQADLLLHRESRLVGDGRPLGAVYPLADRFEPLPARRDPEAEPDVPLPVPNGDPDVAAPTLWGTLDERRSIRAYDEGVPITAGQLGELLYRAARVKGDEPPHADSVSARPDRVGGGQPPYQATFRPYPNGGAMGELELYPLVRTCRGVDAGLYRYDGRAHGLVRIADPSPATDSLLAAARFSMAAPAAPQVLIVIAARIGRLSWKYERIAYSLVLKHVGVLLQTLYLVATGLELAPCAVGTGDYEAFAAASGIDPLAEPSVGEFALGSRAP